MSQQFSAVEAALAKRGPKARISVQQRLQIRRLLELRPELCEADNRHRLILALTAVLASTQAEAAVVRTALKTYTSPVPEAHAAWQPLLAIVFIVVSLGLVFSSVRSGCTPSPVRSADAGVDAGLALAVPDGGPRPDAGLEMVDRVGEVRQAFVAPTKSTQATRPLTGSDYAQALLGAFFAGLGSLALFIRRKKSEQPSPPAPKSEEAYEGAYGAKLEAYEEELLKTYRVRTRCVARTQSFEHGSIVESAGVLGRLRHPARARDLDVDPTVLATAEAGGMFKPVLRPRHRPSALLVLVDTESGDHVWLGAVRRVLLDWADLGVPVEVFEFKFAPRRLTPQAEGPRLRLAALLSAHPDQPILVVSRRLDRDVGDRELPDWLLTLTRRAVCAWLDPDPRRSKGTRAAVIRDFEAVGLSRFPFTDRGLVAVAHYLVTAGQSAARADWPDLPDHLKPELQEGLRRWALAAALVPEATWDNIEMVRRHESLQEQFPNRADADLLLRWVADHVPGAGGDLGAGRGLDLDVSVVNQWIADQRTQDAQWERLWREHWLDELLKQRPEDALEEARRRLRIARHRYHLGTGTIADLEAQRGGLVEPEALRDINQAKVLKPITPPAPAPTEPKPLPLGPPYLPRAAYLAGLVCAGLTFAAFTGSHRLSAPWFEVLEVTQGLNRPAEYRVELNAVPAGPTNLAATTLRPRMLVIPAGEFLMGSPEDEVGRYDDELQHSVKITKPFFMARTEVTQAQWFAVMATRPSSYSGDARPVEKMSWFDAIAYLNELTAQEAGLTRCYEPECKQDGDGDLVCSEVRRVVGCTGYRLPTEAEWEYAARGNKPAPDLDEVAWYRDSASGTHEVATKLKNGFGLHDMLGNVWEWVEDESNGYSVNPAGEPVRDPVQYTADARYAVVRGCGFDSSPASCRAAGRVDSDRASRRDNLGFRPARSVSP